MARSKRSANLDSRNKRLALEAGKRFMEPLQAGSYIVYQRPKNGASGAWLARWYDPETRKQVQCRIGNADDFVEADGLATLTFPQAQAKAGLWFKEQVAKAALLSSGEAVPSGPYLVADAIRDYLDDALRRGMKGHLITTQTAKAHILPSLGSIPAAKLSRRKIEDWHLLLAEAPRRRTGKARTEVEHLDPASTDEDRRKRRNTANRILTVLRAALNHAYARSKIVGPTPWRDVKPFKGVSASRIRSLSVDEQRRLIEACEGTFRHLVQAALFTGARFGELARLKVEDYSAAAGTLFIEFSKSGHSRHIWLTEEASGWFKAFLKGRVSTEVMLQRDQALRDRKARDWQNHDQKGLMDAACKVAGLESMTFHELRHTYASTLVNSGVPLAFVAAQLGHMDSRMVEKYYGHLCPTAQAESIRALVPRLGFSEPA